MVWRQAERERNVEEIHRTASELMSRIQSWLSSYATLGEQIDKVSAAYAESKRILSDSNQSVIQKIKKLEKHGVAPKRTAIKVSSRKSGPESVIPAALSRDAAED